MTAYILISYGRTNDYDDEVHFGDDPDTEVSLGLLLVYKKIYNRDVELGFIKGFKIIDADSGLVVYERFKA